MMDVVNVEQARIAEEAGVSTCTLKASFFTEPSDILKYL